MKFKYRRKIFPVLLVIVVTLIAIRLVLPSFVLKKMNQHLAEFSPSYQIHIRDLDLHLFRMAYSFEDVEGKLKEDSFQFMALRRVNVSLAWREIFRGRFVADVDLIEADLKLTTGTIKAMSGKGEQVKADAKDVKDSTIPFSLERLRFQNSRFEFSDVADLPPDQNFTITGVEAVATNLTPKAKDGLSLFTLIGSLQEKAKIKAVGELRINEDPLDWNINVETKNFNLTDLNPIAKRMIPMTFKTGHLSLFAAAQSVDGKVKGYVKPFLKDLVLVGDRADFKNVSQFLYEIAGTIGNFFLQNRKTDALATRVNFRTVNDKIVGDTSKAIGTAIENKFGTALSQSMDETLELP